ncbi:Alkylhydroperoxidase family enzyme [Halalkaliarchaeum sp. AArc-CO]|uniref:peroxidase-related enzyme n=1 Tax=Halalkaliarchaeum sp. AArc-CO TaxID=2866381 RepID=UPI00217F011F|nr:peroxidase-related enzyme [Halalkaliarchaeum sp. AArc-CO]UWG50740.1 Alkylhydroperoxidase family enzyme [Halalkaliarchaeum sp. AArc-CO]
MSGSEPTLSDDAQRNFPVPEFGELPADLQERIAQETADAGFTPNVFAALAHRPEHFRPFVDFHDAIVEESALDRAEIEMIVVAVSGVNHCLYCNVAHGALCRIYAGDPQLAEQLISNYRTADVSDAHRVMLEVAVKLTERPETVTREDLDRLYDAGFSEAEVWDVGVVAAFFNLSNRLATFADWRPNDEFYELGRVKPDGSD